METAENHRKLYSNIKNYDDLLEWLAISLEHNDLNWPLYHPDNYFDLGSDSEGGTNGKSMADIVRITKCCTHDSQESLIKWDKEAPVQNYVNLFFSNTEASKIRTLSFQRSYISLFGEVNNIMKIISQGIEMNLIGDSKNKLIKAFIWLPNDKKAKQVSDDGDLIKPSKNSYSLTWCDWYSDEGL